MALDRTREFMTFVQEWEAHGPPGSASSALLAASAPMSPLMATAAHGPLRRSRESSGAFTQAAAAASRELHMTSMKISKLTQLVRRRGVFEGDGGSSSSEIDALTMSIKLDVTRLNGTLDALQSFVDARKAEASKVGAQPGQVFATSTAPGGGGSSSAAAAASGDVTSSVQGLVHSDAVLAGLKDHLLSFAGSLRAVVTLRSETMRQSDQRRRQFGSGPVRDLGKPLVMPGTPLSRPDGESGSGGGSGHTAIDILGTGAGAGAGAEASSARRAAMYGGYAGGTRSALAAGMPGGAGAGASPAGGAFGMVAQAQLAAEPELSYLAARAQDVAAIETSIHELSGLFSRLAGLVSEQGESVARIDADMDDAVTRMEAGEGELRRHYDSVSSSRNLAIKVVGVLVAFAVGFSVFVV